MGARVLGILGYFTRARSSVLEMGGCKGNRGLKLNVRWYSDDFGQKNLEIL